MDKEYLQSLYTPEQQLLLFGDANYFNNQNTNNNLPFTSMADMAAKNANLDLFPSPQEFYTSPTYLMKQAQKFNQNPFRTGITSVIPLEQDPIAVQQGFVEGSPSDTSYSPLGIDTSFGVANEPDVEVKEKSGIAKLFDFLSNFIPGVGLIRRLGDIPGGIRGLNQRIQQSDFGRSRTLADYFDARRYGGRDERAAAAAKTMAEARDIQEKIDEGEFGTRDRSIDRGRGSIPSRTTSAPRRSSSSYSAANRAFAGSR